MRKYTHAYKRDVEKSDRKSLKPTAYDIATKQPKLRKEAYLLGSNNFVFFLVQILSCMFIPTEVIFLLCKMRKITLTSLDCFESLGD